MFTETRNVFEDDFTLLKIYHDKLTKSTVSSILCDIVTVKPIKINKKLNNLFQLCIKYNHQKII